LQRGHLGGLLGGAGPLFLGRVQRFAQPVGVELERLGAGGGDLLVVLQRSEIFLGLGLFGLGF
jgi:hypothetical protein